MSQCLKITKNVSFYNIVSEASLLVSQQLNHSIFTPFCWVRLESNDIFYPILLGQFTFYSIFVGQSLCLKSSLRSQSCKMRLFWDILKHCDCIISICNVVIIHFPSGVLDIQKNLQCLQFTKKEWKLIYSHDFDQSHFCYYSSFDYPQCQCSFF